MSPRQDGVLMSVRVVRLVRRLCRTAGRPFPSEFALAILLHGLLPFIGAAAGTGTILATLLPAIAPELTPAGPYHRAARALVPAWFERQLAVAVACACLIALICALAERLATAVEERAMRLAAVTILVLSVPVLDWVTTIVLAASPVVAAWMFFPQILIYFGLAESDPDLDDEGR